MSCAESERHHDDERIELLQQRDQRRLDIAEPDPPGR